MKNDQYNIVSTPQNPHRNPAREHDGFHGLMNTDQGSALVGVVVSCGNQWDGGGLGAAAPASISQRMNLRRGSIFNYSEVKEVSKVYCIRLQDATLSDYRTTPIRKRPVGIRKQDGDYPIVGRSYPKVTHYNEGGK
jgi:hypothetical protein